MTAKLAKEKKKMKTLTLGSWVAFWNSFCQACFFTSSRKEMASTQMLWLISFNAEQKLKHWCPATSTLSAKTKKQVPRGYIRCVLLTPYNIGKMKKKKKQKNKKIGKKRKKMKKIKKTKKMKKTKKKEEDEEDKKERKEEEA